MMSRTSLLSLLLAVMAMAPVSAGESRAWAFTNVTVIPMDTDRVIPAQTVIVRDGRIVDMGPANRLSVPRDARRIDGRGRYLMPGLAEMHAHVPPQADAQQATREVLFLYVANGITFARGMLGAPHHLKLREQAAKGEIVSPHLYTSGPSLNGNSVATPEDGRRMVIEQKRAGYDFLKIHPGLDRERYDAIVDEARAQGITWAGHVPHEVGLARALEVGQATIDHLDAYFPELLRDDSSLVGANPGFFGHTLAGEVDEAKITAIARRTREAGVWNVPTQSLIEHVLAPGLDLDAMSVWPEMAYVSRQTVQQWAQVKRNFMAAEVYDADTVERFIALRRQLIKALHDEGAGLLLGSDAPQIFNVPGFAIHHELRMLVESGLTPYEALRTGTANVAEFIGQADKFGTVATGKRADLILLEANPLVNIAAVQMRAGVMVNGRWLPEAELRAGLKQVAEQHP